MLVLTRKQQEKIRIGDGITITVLKMKGKSVRLGIEAPLDVPVVRGELMFKETQPAEAGMTLDGAEDHEPSLDSQATRHAQMPRSNWIAEGNALWQRIPRVEADELRRPLRAMLEARIGTAH